MKNQTIIILLSALLLAAAAFIAYQNLWGEANSLPPTSVDIEELVEQDKEFESSLVVAEETADAALTAISARDRIVSWWQAADDPLSQVSFERTGEVRDVYAGGAINESGNYQIFDSLSTLPQEIQDNSPDFGSGAVYLRQTFGSEDYYYVIDELSSETLLLFYLPRGNVLEYSRIDI